MSLARSLSFVCDHEGNYGVVCDEEIIRWGGISAQGLADEARKEGWSVGSASLGPHLCPEHAK